MFQLLFHFTFYYQGNLVYCIYFCIFLDIFKDLLLLTENKESYLYYYYIKVLRFSLDPLPRSLSLPICCCNIIVQIMT